MPPDRPAAVPREARAFQWRTAGPVTRLLVAAVDVLVVAAILLGAYGGLVVSAFMLRPQHAQLPRSSFLLTTTAAAAVAIVYLATSWAVTGRTYGSHVMGVRVVDRRARAPALPVALARAVICTVIPIGLLWCAISRDKKSLADVVLRTRVVYDWTPRGRTS